MTSYGSQQESGPDAPNVRFVSEAPVLTPSRSASGHAAANGHVRAHGRSIRRARPLPSGRALVGAFLVAAATLGIFLAWSGAERGPSTSYLVAARDLPIGTKLSPADLRAVPMELPAALAASSAFGDPAELDGVEVINPIRAGELVQGSSLVGSDAAPTDLEISFAVERDRAVGGRLKAGEHVDLLATFGTGADTYTTTVLQGARILDIASSSDALGSTGPITITLAVSDADEARAVAHAVNVAELTLVRSNPDETRSEQGGTYRAPAAAPGS